MLSAAVLGATMGAAGATAVHRRAMPEPKPLRPMTRVVIDRTVSEVPLSLGAFTQGDGEGYGLMEQWLPRLGCFLTRRSGPEAFSDDALVVICPSGSVTREYRRRLVEYVAAGGKLLVIDSPENEGTTVNSLLWPFGMSVEHAAPPRGKLSLLTGWPDVELGESCRVVGGEPFLWVGDTPVAARTTHGKGSVMAVGFGSLWNDESMGNHWMQEPDPAMALRFDVLFAVVGGFLDDRPVTPPAAGESAAAGAAPADSRNDAPEDR